MGGLFVIPVIVDIHGHIFEVFTLVSEIHEKVDLVMGIKNVFELEGVKDSHQSSFNFLNRSIPFISNKQIVLKLKQQKFIKIGTFCGRDFRDGSGQNARQMRTSCSYAKA